MAMRGRFGRDRGKVSGGAGMVVGVLRFVSVGVVGGVLVLSSSVAFAAAPEAPETTAASAVSSSSATLNGVLNPGVSATAGYEFAYNTNGTCTEGPVTELGVEATGQAIPVSTLLTGLEPSREYTFCVLATHLEGETLETTSSASEHFTTLPEAPKVDGESVSGVSAFGATLEAQVNPNNQETATSFQYSTQASGETLEGEVINVPGGALGPEFGDRPASAATGLVLQAGVTYFYRAIAENASGEKSEGKVEAFTTLGTPVVSASEASSVTRSSATIGGEVDASGALTRYFVEYGVGGAHGAPGSPTSVAVLEAQPAGPQKVGPVVLEELRPGTTYDYRIVAVNEAGTTDGAEESFRTAPPQSPGAATGEASEVSQTVAAITGTVNPNGLATTYAFEVGSEVIDGVAVYTASTYGEAGGESTAEPEHVVLTNLLPGRTYHYRLIAVNMDGTSYGEDRTFTTPGFASPPAEPATPALLAFTYPAEPPIRVVRTSTKSLTRAQKLARALRACHAKRGRNRRGCETAARGKYGHVKRRSK